MNSVPGNEAPTSGGYHAIETHKQNLEDRESEKGKPSSVRTPKKQKVDKVVPPGEGVIEGVTLREGVFEADLLGVAVLVIEGVGVDDIEIERLPETEAVTDFDFEAETLRVGVADAVPEIDIEEDSSSLTALFHNENNFFFCPKKINKSKTWPKCSKSNRIHFTTSLSHNSPSSITASISMDEHPPGFK